jgi:DNA modification methylase
MSLETFLDKIICGDSREVLKKIPSDSIDLIVTSPPYWDTVKYDKSINDIKNIGRDQSLSSYLSEIKEVVSECYRVLKTGHYLHVIIRDVTKDRRTYPLHAEIARVSESVGFVFEDLKLILLLSHAHYDFDVILRKGDPLSKFRMVDRYDEPFWDLRGFYKAKIHPAMFIEQIPSIIIQKYTKSGDIVLDPFCGSGTTPLVSKALNRKYICVEISEEYCKIAETRVSLPIKRINPIKQLEIIDQDALSKYF